MVKEIEFIKFEEIIEKSETYSIEQVRDIIKMFMILTMIYVIFLLKMASYLIKEIQIPNSLVFGIYGAVFLYTIIIIIQKKLNRK